MLREAATRDHGRPRLAAKKASRRLMGGSYSVGCRMILRSFTKGAQLWRDHSVALIIPPIVGLVTYCVVLLFRKKGEA